MNLIVTGGAGFIGSNFIRRALNSQNFQFSKVTIIDALTYSGNMSNCSDFIDDPRIDFKVCDIRDYDSLAKIIPKHDQIINFAAESHVDRSITSSSIFVETNILGTNNLLELAVRNQVKKFIQVSTDEVYGSLLTGSADEDHGLYPNSPYAASKASADLLARSFWVTHGLGVCITRSSNNFGPYQHPEKLIPKAIMCLLKGKQIPIYGDGRNIRDWISVSDNCEGLLTVLQNGEYGQIYNIGGGNEYTNLEMITLLADVLQLSKPYSQYFRFVSDRKGHDFRYSVDSSRIKEILNFKINSDFKEKLKETVEWYAKNLDWCENSLNGV
jgi:dTDP-glucose 4,6-dehydratase